MKRFVEFAPARWLAAVAGLVLGLFVARVAYEMWPGPLAALIFWPAGPALALSVTALVTVLYRFAPRIAGIGYRVFLPWFLLLLYILQPSVNPLQAIVLFAGMAALSLMYLAQALGAQEWQMRWGARLVLIAAVLALYLLTAGRTVGKADTFEFQVVAPALGVAHPTGYPLFILLGKLFSLLPFGQVAWRVNLVSLACAVVAVGLTYSVMGVISRSLLASSRSEAEGGAGHSSLAIRRSSFVIAALALAASAVFWSQAIVAEVYALNAVFVALVLWLALYGLDRRQRAADWDARRWLFTLALVYGISLTNHLTMTLLAPMLVLTLRWVRPRASWLDWLAAAVLFVLGLSIYSYILARWPALHNGQGMPFSDFIGWITGRQFGGALQPWLWRDPTRWRILGRLLLEAYGPIGAGLAALGLVSLALPWGRERNARRVALITVLAFAAYCAYALIYNVPDISVFLIPAHLVMALWLGVGLVQISEFGIRNNEQPATSNQQPATALHFPFSTFHSLIPHISSLIFLLLPLGLVWTNLPQVDQSRAGQSLVDWGHYVLSLPLPRQAAILADSEKIAPLYYLKSVEGVRSDVDMLVLGSEELYRAELDKRVAQGQPVYLARFLPGLAGVYRLHSVGPLVRVSTAPQSTLPLVPITQQLNVAFGEGKVKLLGYDLSSGQDDVAYHLTLYWQAKTALTSNYHVRLRLVSEAGAIWWEDPGTHPVSGYDPTVAWLPGEVVPDYHEVPTADTTPPGRYHLQVGLFVPFRDEGLVLDGSTNQEWYDVAQVDLDQAVGQGESPSALPIALRANMGGQVLLRGASQPGVIPPGGRGEVTLEWERLASAADYAVRDLQITLVRANGTPAAVVRVKPFAGEYPVSRWDIGRPIRMQVPFPVPDQPGEYTLRVGWVTDQNRWVTARCGWMGRAANECTVTTLRVEGARRESGINFADQVVLVRSQVGGETLRPGEKLEVNLHWQGLKAWPADYTAFVHLVGPDGKLYGQVDAYPVQGTLPTSQWKAGQLVDDPYVVTLAPDAPAGEYQVEVGWYLLATLRRLSVLDSAGRPVDDRVIVGKVSVAP